MVEDVGNIVAFRYPYTDALGSIAMETCHSANTTCRQSAHLAFGAPRAAGGVTEKPITDHRFTGQKEDATGLYYFNARYYDPEIGQFISPDTIVPDPLRVDAYNRYMYAYGNPLKFNDPSGHFSEQQLIEWYGENWRDQFAAEWQKLLLDDPGSSNFGAQLGDLVAYGDSQGILVLDPDNQLALWDFNAKSAQTVASVGASAPDSLGLYRIKGGLSGENGGLFGPAHQGKYLPATGGAGYGPFAMELLPGYSTGSLNPSASVPADWFMGGQDSNHYVNSRIAFDGFNFSLGSVIGGSFTGLGAWAMAVNFAPGIGAISTIGGSSTAIYELIRYRPTYQMLECANTICRLVSIRKETMLYDWWVKFHQWRERTHGSQRLLGWYTGLVFLMLSILALLNGSWLVALWFFVICLILVLTALFFPISSTTPFAIETIGWIVMTIMLTFFIFGIFYTVR